MAITGLLLFDACHPHGQSVQIEQGEVFFTPAVPDSTVRKSVQYLQSIGYFSHSSGSIQIDRRNEIDIFRIVVKPEALKDSITQATLRDFGHLLHRDLFPQKTFLLHACNADFKTLKAYRFGSGIRQ